MAELAWLKRSLAEALAAFVLLGAAVGGGAYQLVGRERPAARAAEL